MQKFKWVITLSSFAIVLIGHQARAIELSHTELDSGSIFCNQSRSFIKSVPHEQKDQKSLGSSAARARVASSGKNAATEAR